MIRKILIVGVAMAALSVAACKKPADAANNAADATPAAATNTTAPDAAAASNTAATDAKGAMAAPAAANAAPAGDMKADAAKK